MGPRSVKTSPWLPLTALRLCAACGRNAQSAWVWNETGSKCGATETGGTEWRCDRAGADSAAVRQNCLDECEAAAVDCAQSHVCACEVTEMPAESCVCQVAGKTLDNGC
jgi:hypothetical protein